MKNMLSRFILGLALIIGIAFAGSLFRSNGGLAVSGQGVMKKVENAVVDTSKTVYKTTKKGAKKGFRVGQRVGDRVWTGTKWVGRNAWKGGTWIAVKTANGTRWVYRKGKRAVYGPPRRIA